MSFDLEKGAGASNASVQQSTAARLSNFPPTYEQHVNDNMRDFESEFQEVKLREFDDIQDPKPTQRKRKCPTWMWLLTGISILLITAALLGGLMIHYMNKQNSHDDKVSTTSSAAITSALTSTEVTSQTPLATRAEQTTTISPSTMTVYITETPPTPSTQVVMTTIIASTSTPSIVTIFSTTTASSSESTSASSTSTTSTLTTAAPSTSTINPSEAALRSSIAAENSRISDKLIPSPIPTTEISTTTATEVSISTPPPEPSKTLIPMPGGEIGRCGVPGQSCNGKREVEVRDREEFYIGVCGLPGQSCN